MSVVRVLISDSDSSSRRWGGNGFVVQFVGGTCLIMTNYHVAHGASGIDVLLPPNGQEFTGGYVQEEDLDADLAIVRFDKVDGEFRPMVFAEFASLNFSQPVYLLAYLSCSDSQPVRSPGRINGMFIEKNICFFHGNFASQPGTSGGPVMMGGKVVAVNCGAGGGSRRAISLLAVYNALMAWCDCENGNYTIAEMLQKLI